ncbi:MAG: hypothetical protein M1598_06875 [Actinobacteria bacterium]|nr:hypothetical protein [Actinomycetota bacterium]
MYKIKQVKAAVVEIPLKKQWQISLYAASTRRHAVVQVITEDGVIGYGEASPSPAFMGETADTIKQVIDGYLAAAIQGGSVLDLETIHTRMDGAIYGNTAAKSAVDIAVHDALGKNLRVPASGLIGGVFRSEVPLSWVVGIQTLEGGCREAVEFARAGFRVIKIKIGKDPASDLALVDAVRTALREEGLNTPIRLDVNQGYDAGTAIRTLRAIEEAGGIESVEQPVRRWDLDGLKEVREALKTPVMADEAIFDLYDAAKVIRARAADIINIKVGKVGGLYKAKKIAALAEASGVACTVGSNLELGIGTMASLHFAASTKAVTYPSDLMLGPYLHTAEIVAGDVTSLVAQGAARVPETPGLGVDLAEAFRG